MAVILPEPLAGEVRVMLADDQHVPGVKLVRDRTALNLRTAVLGGLRMWNWPMSLSFAYWWWRCPWSVM